jgi:phage terminase large subunit GpA-like protein
LTGEQLVEHTINGRTVYRWEKTRQRQEALDCAVYVRAASIIYGIDKITPTQWEALRADLSAPRKRTPKPRAKKVDDYWGRR